VAEYHQADSITRLLGLEGYVVEELREEGDRWVVEVRREREEETCPGCGCSHLYRHGKGRARRVLHGWNRGRRIYLLISRLRWRCCGCGHSFSGGEPLLRPYSRLTIPAEEEALWELKCHSFREVRRRLGVGYGTLRRLLASGVSQEALKWLGGEEAIFLGIDEHSFRHQDMVFTVTEVQRRRVLGILQDDRMSSLKAFLAELPKERVQEVCIDMRGGLWKAIEAVFPLAKVVVDPFHVIADANKRFDEARRIEQEVRGKRANIPKRLFLVGREKLREEQRQKVDALLKRYPSLTGFYWAKEALREFYRQGNKAMATKQLDNIILNLKAGDDGELIRWGNTLKRWREPILNHFNNHTTNGFTEGCHTKLKMLKRLSYGLRNVEVYARKMLLGFLPPSLHTN